MHLQVLAAALELEGQEAALAPASEVQVLALASLELEAAALELEVQVLATAVKPHLTLVVAGRPLYLVAVVGIPLQVEVVQSLLKVTMEAAKVAQMMLLLDPRGPLAPQPWAWKGLVELVELVEVLLDWAAEAHPQPWAVRHHQMLVLRQAKVPVQKQVQAQPLILMTDQKKTCLSVLS